ncbi:nuclear transport factor 2 family protein [Aureibaculum sp. 2210JD6-5]|uniref:nuclear transport factor 2 family protein n=1 Tax=Aureibaculum sp. 2210JD6-5 TaxID=3103957 RepID=UPI002AAD7ABF|nr:nuclear transport factor 2 family protein [Aureibaculum sp. 2210JD6-5]MDY7395099.1 nuclear transport factor 2 family protein [Aureibaculum sp. 2210JD6-5]
MKTLKTIMALALTLFLTPVISNAQETTLEFENAESAQNLVVNYVKALQAGDVAKMTEQLAPNAMIYGLGGGLDSLTVNQHATYFKNSFDTYTHVTTGDLYLPVKVTDNWNEGEWVLAWGTNTVTNKKSGNKIVIPFHSANLVDNGKIIMIRYFYDMANIMKNSGWTLTPPKE